MKTASLRGIIVSEFYIAEHVITATHSPGRSSLWSMSNIDDGDTTPSLISIQCDDDDETANKVADQYRSVEVSLAASLLHHS